jgi:tetratricopeptide (TPR) repeat protein
MLACHRLFSDCGELNRSKILRCASSCFTHPDQLANTVRKRILCALATRDYSNARAIFHQMSEIGKEEQLTRYLAFKVAVRSGDREFAADCLESLSKRAEKDATLLYACVLESLQTGDRDQAILALQKVLKKYNYGAPPGVNIAALLRYVHDQLLSQEEALI